MINAMNKIIQTTVLALALATLFTNCRKKAWDEFYGRPDSLADPIYQQLNAKGNFKSLLALIDKSGYKETMSAAGYWTLFAPNDEAFKTWFQEKGISSIDGIDSATSRAMIQYLLVYNSFKKDRLDDYQATIDNAGWTPSQAFRRRTAYYTGFYKDTGINGRPLIAIANNRNNFGALDGSYVSNDYNNKYITYFTDDYFSTHNLSGSDYTYFYPGSEFTGFNVDRASVVAQDLPAENGMIHEIDKVITPLMSIDEYIRTRPEYSSFKALLNRMGVNSTVQFIYNADATHRYQVLTGKSDSVFVKAYSPFLAFSPNNENFVKLEDNDGQKDCWTMFIPKNDAVDSYIKNVLCEYYPSLDQMPLEIIADFLNSHLFPTAVWPSKFEITRNKLSEPARFDPLADVFDRKILSNGFVYGTNKVQEADVFSTIFSKAYLNPDYTMMTRLLNASGLRLLIAKSNVAATVFLIPDQVFAAAGFSYNVSKDQFEYRPPGGSATTNSVFDKLIRIVQTCVFFNPYKDKIADLSGRGIVKSGDAGTEGDFIKFDNNTIITAGLEDKGMVAKVDSFKFGTNGKVYYLDQLPVFSEKGVGTHIKKLGEDEASEFHYFWKYLESSVVYNPNTTEIIGLTGFNTLFIPTNEAMLQAVNDGLLPGTGTAPNMVPNFAPTDEPNKDLVRKFLQYHILSGRTVIPDGNAVNGLSNSFLKDEEGNSIRFSLNSAAGSLSLTDNYNLTKPGSDKVPANAIVPMSNHLSSRAVIHLIDKYLNYNLYN